MADQQENNSDDSIDNDSGNSNDNDSGNSNDNDSGNSNDNDSDNSNNNNSENNNDNDSDNSNDNNSDNTNDDDQESSFNHSSDDNNSDDDQDSSFNYSSDDNNRDNDQESVFKQAYRCYPVSALNKPHLETGDKIIMPASALERLAYLLIDYPMLFQLHNPAIERVSHCGVLEFTADEGVIYLQNWMMENMKFKEGDRVNVKTATLSKGTYVKLQPHSKAFLDITNPRAILEKTLRNFTCLTTGDTIMVPYNNNKYYIDILETQPTRAITIIETDCEVDFAPPLDYEEPKRPEPSSSIGKKEAEAGHEEVPKDEPKFMPFTGVARRLDGKPSTESAQAVPSPVLKSQKSEGTNGSTSSTNSLRKRSGKLVFDSNAEKGPKQAPKPKVSLENTMPEPEKKNQTFKPFSGKSYSLGG